MKRDMELVRDILTSVEDLESPDDITSASKIADRLGGTSKEKVQYHVEIMNEGGLLDATLTHDSGGGVISATVSRMTWEGHEFLDAARNSDIWAQVQNAASEKSLSLTMDVMKHALKHYTEEKLGLK